MTRFANIEFIAYQWLMQAGTWRMRKIAILPGTNFVIRKEALLKAGAWDIKALTEDTELSFRLFSLGYVIEFFPLAVSWEQEPEEWRAWRRQRLRWVQGNKYIVQSYLHEKKMRQANLLNVLYMFLIYYVLLFSIVFSDIIFICGLTNLVRLSFAGPLIALWGFAFVIFVLEIAIALTCEVGEDNWSNFGLAALMYFTYCQQWLYVALKSYISIKKREDGVFWTKTQRF